MHQQAPDNYLAAGAMPEQHVENMVAKEFNLQEAKKRLKILQETKVSREDDLSTPKVVGGASKSDSYAGKSLANILMVELYAGLARLSKACQQVGVRSIAVDKTTQRAQGKSIFVCDVTDEGELSMLQAF